MVLYELKSLIAPRRARIFDGAVLIIVTLAALFYCYGVEVFPDDSKPHTLEADELLLVSNILFGGLFVCALRWLIEQQRGISRIAAELASGASREPVPPFLFDKPNAKCDVGTNENFGSHFEAVRVQPLASSARAAIKQVAPTPPGRPSKSATIEARLLTRLQLRASTCLSFPERMLTRGFVKRRQSLGPTSRSGSASPSFKGHSLDDMGPEPDRIKKSKPFE